MVILMYSFRRNCLSYCSYFKIIVGYEVIKVEGFLSKGVIWLELNLLNIYIFIIIKSVGYVLFGIKVNIGNDVYSRVVYNNKRWK